MGHAHETDDAKRPVEVEKPSQVITKVDLVPAAGTPVEAKAVRGLPGFKEACGLVAAALTAEAASVLLHFDGQSCEVRWRTPAGWLAGESLVKDAAVPLLVVFKALATPLNEVGPGMVSGACIITEKRQWRCRLTRRTAEKREHWLLQFSEALPVAAGFVQRLNGMVSGFLPTGRRKGDAQIPAAPSGPASLDVKLHAQGVSEPSTDLDGLKLVNGLCGQALAMRACCIRLESAGGRVCVRADVDGVWRSFDQLDKAAIAAALVAFKTLAKFSSGAGRLRQTGKCEATVKGKSWPCTIIATRVQGGERLDVNFSYGRPALKIPADAGMDESLRQRVQQLVALPQGVVVVAAPRRNGLSTLFEHVVLMTDRLTRDLISIEDVAMPAHEVQNVKTCCWDMATNVAPVDAVDRALRQYPQGLLACDLTDAALAVKLVDLAKQGQFVVLGVNGGDVGDALTALLALGVPADQLGRMLLGGVAGRLVRKLCLKCREEYLPAVDELGTMRLDPAAAVTLWRAPAEGCEVCGGTGYVGRTGVFEVAAGRTLQHYVAKAADAATLRKAAVKDGMVPIAAAALDLVKAGVTSLDEVRRVFAPPSSQTPRPTPPAG